MFSQENEIRGRPQFLATWWQAGYERGQYLAHPLADTEERRSAGYIRTGLAT
jgi:hypothetical protein